MKSKGIDAIVNDQLVGNVLGLGMLLLTAMCGFTAYFLLEGRVQDNELIIITIVSCLLGLFVMGVATSIISSGVVTIFVCLAEDPRALQRNNPVLFDKIVQVYPSVIF